MEPMGLDLFSEMRLAGVASDAEAKALVGDFEPLLVTDERANLVTMVEDELLLALPAAPRHGEGDGCALPPRYRADPARTRPLPFADLARLRGRVMRGE